MNRRTDPWLISFVALLLVLGTIMVYSASAVVAQERIGDEMYYFNRQLIAAGIGLTLAAITALIPVRYLRRYRVALYTATLVGLALCFVPGIQYRANGAARWIGFGSFHLQPSEFVKITTMIMMAEYLEKNRRHIRDLRVVIKAVLIPLPAILLVLPEPDFGTAALIAILSGVMLVIAGMKSSHIAGAVVLVGGVGVPVMLLESYRIQRITSFLDPWRVSSGEGYHVIQSWVAMHSGGLWGQGLGNSMAKLHFLPEPWTDFIAAVTAEELGLVGVLVLLSLYGGLVLRGIHIARTARNAHGMVLAVGITTLLGLQSTFNLGVVMGVLPPKGLVLPFVSYGASALIAHLWSIGILLSIAAESSDVPIEEGWRRRKTRKPRASAEAVMA